MATYYLSNTGVINPGHSAFISLNLFLCLVLGGQLTGAHTNPAITLTLLIGKGNFKINPINAIVYIIAQFAGSFAGAAIGTFLLITKLWELSKISVFLGL